MKFCYKRFIERLRGNIGRSAKYVRRVRFRYHWIKKIVVRNVTIEKETQFITWLPLVGN